MKFINQFNGFTLINKFRLFYYFERWPPIKNTLYLWLWILLRRMMAYKMYLLKCYSQKHLTNILLAISYYNFRLRRRSENFRENVSSIIVVFVIIVTSWRSFSILSIDFTQCWILYALLEFYNAEIQDGCSIQSIYETFKTTTYIVKRWRII